MAQAALQAVREQLAPTGVLRAAINMSNFLLVTGREADGCTPAGVSPDLARAVADRLGVDLALVPFEGPGVLADAVALTDDGSGAPHPQAWDIGNIGAEPERAKTICFTPPYCEIQATYLVSDDHQPSSF